MSLVPSGSGNTIPAFTPRHLPQAQQPFTHGVSTPRTAVQYGEVTQLQGQAQQQQ